MSSIGSKIAAIEFKRYINLAIPAAKSSIRGIAWAIEMTGKLSIAAIVSAAIHIILFIIIIVATHSFRTKAPGIGPGEGSGDGVMISDIIGEGGATIKKRARMKSKKAAIPAISDKLKIKSTKVQDLKAVAAAKTQSSNSNLAPGPERSGTGLGIGAGSGTGGGGDEILHRIWKKIDRSKYYPIMARRQKLEGSPGVSFEIDSNGGIKWVRIAKSCGKTLLDDAALETIRRSAPLPFYPKPITISVKYSLKQE